MSKHAFARLRITKCYMRLLVGTSGDRIKHSCPSALGDKACSCLPHEENSICLAFQEMKPWSRDKNSQSRGRCKNLNWKSFLMSQCRIYGVFSCGEWNHPCKVCGNLDVRDVIISSRKSSEFVQLECAEFGKFQICHSSKRHLCFFWMPHFLLCLLLYKTFWWKPLKF